MAVPDSIAALAAKLGGQLSFAAHHLGTGERIEHDVARRYPAASLIKVPMMATLLASAEAGHLDLQATMTLRSADQIGDEGSLHHEAPGSEWTLWRLIELMIQVSDNTATNLLIDRMGGFVPYNDYFPHLGLQETVLQRRMFDWAARQAGRENWTTPADMLALMTRLARKELVDPGVSRQMMQVLIGQQDREKIPALLPPEFPVANKPGELDGGVRHDMAVVMTHTGPCVLVLMSQGVDEAIADETLAQIALELFAAVGGEAYVG